MLTLYSYPTLFGVADNNGYGLKVYAFLRLVGLPFRHEHVFDASKAPRSQLPYIDDDGQIVGDSGVILEHLTRKYGLTLDADLNDAQRNTDLLVTRLLDAKAYNANRYHWQGIDRYAPDEAMARGVADLKVVADLLRENAFFVHGATPTSIDAGIYGFIANILYYDIDTPLKRCVEAHPQLVRHCRAIHASISG